jgi:hypothetical protein
MCLSKKKHNYLYVTIVCWLALLNNHYASFVWFSIQWLTSICSLEKISKLILHLIYCLLARRTLSLGLWAKLKAYLSQTIRTRSMLLLCVNVAKKWRKCSKSFHYTMLPCFPLITQFWLYRCIRESSDIFP